jgi:hypothetical protein
MTLAEIIRDRIPPSVLERVVFDQGILTPEARAALFKASGLSLQEIALQVVALYGEKAYRLASGLYNQVYETDWRTAELLHPHLKRDPAHYHHNLQASLVGSIPTLPIDGLRSFLDSVTGHICLIVCQRGNAGQVRCGTGFLVGPDLVLTCRHVLEDFDTTEDVLANGNQIELYFDFNSGEPVDRPGLSLPGTKKVGLSPQWHVASCPHTRPDGVDGVLSEADAQRITGALDFILLRLDQKVGLQPIQQSGGRRRRWIDFPEDTVPRTLQALDWIIIPQHPGGKPQRIDLGRYKEPDQTRTRIRYNTNTGKGTSGAPCFNHNFHLVGVHNAYVGPEATPLANQAIRGDYIAAAVRELITEADKKEGKKFLRRWSISRDQDPPRVILGRETLLKWLETSASPKPLTLDDRVYVAQANEPGAGCTFSSDVLHAELRDTKIPRAVYGSGGQQLPATVEDFLISLLRELGIDVLSMAQEKRMPQRPGIPGADPASHLLGGEVDKLERWISDELPNWLGGVITTHVEVEVDARDLAKQALQLHNKLGVEASKALQDQANAPEKISIRPNSWNCAYVVIDELRTPKYQGKGARTELKGEVQSLIAALVKGKPEVAMHPGLKRLRWMFLGYLPDFIPAAQSDGNGATVEVLNPAGIGAADVLEVLNRMANAHLKLSSEEPLARGTVNFVVQTAETQGTPETRLAVLQRLINSWSASLLNEVKN